MTSQTEEPFVRLKDNSDTASSAYAAAGLGTMVSVLFAVLAIKDGELIPRLPIILSFLGLSALASGLAKLLKKFKSYDFAILFSDRIEFPEFRNSRRIIHWNQVSELRWFGSSSSSLSLSVYTNEIKMPLSFFVMKIDDLSIEDRLTFVQYVRQAAVKVEQKNWPSFCRSTAIPLLDTIERQRTSEKQEDSAPLNRREKHLKKINELSEEHPFFASLFMPFMFLLILPALLSRRTCWTVAAMIAFSSFINIRLVWGQWLVPITNICLGTAAALFLFGCFSLSKKPKASGSRQFLSMAKVMSYFTLLLVGIPFAANALAKGWIPINFAQPVKWLSLTLLLAPIFIFPLLTSRHGKLSKDQLEKDALERWESFEQQQAASPFFDK